MLRQQTELDKIEEKKNFENAPLYQKENETLPIEQAMGWSVVSHGALWILAVIIPVILSLLGFQLFMFEKPKPRDIEFVLVNQPEAEPINKKTTLRAERNTKAGGEHNPNKKIAPPQPALPKSAPSQQKQQKPQQIKQPQKTQPQAVKKPMEQPKKVVANKPAPPKPMAKPTIPPTKTPSSMKLPIPPAKGIPKYSATPTGPVTTKPSNSYNSSTNQGSPKPIIASGGYGQNNSTKQSYNQNKGTGSAYSPGGGNIGNPGPGNPKGAPGVDAIKEPNFGPYMSELSRRIKANWDPPRGDESKRVVLLFKIAKDGRLLNIKVVKSSGIAAADRAAMAAVELSAPFRKLPDEFRGTNIDIQFTFDYNVFGVNKF